VVDTAKAFLNARANIFERFSEIVRDRHCLLVKSDRWLVLTKNDDLTKQISYNLIDRL
jgi:hypothetical protein